MVRRIDLLVDATGNERAISPHPALHIDKVVGMADGAGVLGERLPRPIGTAPGSLLPSCPQATVMEKIHSEGWRDRLIEK